MITQDEHNTIVKYLKDIGVNTMEFFEEMYDHICTSFENRKDKSQDMKTHIREVVQPGFGGVKGIHKIRDERTKIRIKLLRKRFGNTFIKYFLGWPNVVTTASVILVSILIKDFFGTKTLFFTAFIIATVLPIIFFCYKLIEFRLKCKKENKPYRVSEAFNVITPLGSLIAQIPTLTINIWNVSQKGQLGQSFLATPQIVVPLSILMILCFLTCRQLYSEEFKIELTH
ncbi:hypothetical protein [Roseivirga pacifica]|uniref:hypothetical protein n=1 Tax=Roseivirga pacifica TaxID=1267423 RepID=UPI0020947232|nr:hypothetical protein [Roseivirga pacifica]MCO6361033.1 hypothetical protein [Roseivirga pacifica]MCO6368922.1 hypothetical protein [Roseivirga pacifica]MCO6373065.1 hypothetical protein [Roseivirga pacifica]MCO6373145.1 hypothetical protein [Roseivirga pacifica]MCO6377598.1 hypothetical protein [Roseivirga pacifica]